MTYWNLKRKPYLIKVVFYLKITSLITKTNINSNNLIYQLIQKREKRIIYILNIK